MRRRDSLSRRVGARALQRVVFPVLAAALIGGCGKGKAPANVEHHTVGRVDLRDVITQTGEVQPVVKVDIKSEASGKIERVYIREGQRVGKGDTILSIDPSRLLFRKKRMDLTVRDALIKKQRAQRALDDARSLEATGTVAARNLIELEESLELADINYRQQHLDLKDLLDQLARTVITAPMSGVVTTLGVDEGEIAVSATSGNQAGTSIATIADISRLEVISQVGEVDYIHLETGQKVLVRPEAIEGAQTVGTISFISLSARKGSGSNLGTFEVRVAIDSIAPGIAPGINVNVDFVILEKKGVVGIPNHFVQKRADRAFVMVTPAKEGDKPDRKPVKVGATDYRHYEILSGLNEGDVVLFRSESEKPRQARPGGGSRGRGGFR